MSVVNIESFDKQDKVIFADFETEIILFSKGSTLEKGFTFRSLRVKIRKLSVFMAINYYNFY